MVNGQWSMVNGQWSMVNGQWSMVNGQWSMVNEKFSMNYVFLPSDANLRLATTSLFAERGQGRGLKNLVKLFVFLCHRKILDMNLVSS
jgi:hypothetical protein